MGREHEHTEHLACSEHSAGCFSCITHYIPNNIHYTQHIPKFIYNLILQMWTWRLRGINKFTSTQAGRDDGMGSKASVSDSKAIDSPSAPLVSRRVLLNQCYVSEFVQI